ncbi:peptidase S8 subtilisin kexin sedolisin [Fusarium heterosporum]|uniref:Peptidase S8 subtilisin kexin sedolisin n=1 Tax=Fusarium heterosporum TaxID=42747 RepID=A0A8H5WLY4_FUSHE|nr:peptidase S8 subtilisin kexin sedolisin [Fusarium heterosporum]
MNTGPRSVQEELQELDFAKDALCRVSIIAADLGARQKLCEAGCLAAKLWIAKRALDTADSNQFRRLQKRLPKLLDDLERLCAWPSASDVRRPLLHSILRQGTYKSLHGAESQVQKGISAFLTGPGFVKEQYFKNLDQFSQKAMRVKQTELKGSKLKAPDTEEYPRHVNVALYSVLRDHSQCNCMGSCSTNGVRRHHARLKLRPGIVKVDDEIAFEMLIASDPNSWKCWQDLQLTVSMLSNRMKLVLAYIVSRSFWQYYDSPWMNTKWTSDSMHFLSEPLPDEHQHADRSGGFYASRPYYVVCYEKEGDEFMEYCDSYSVIYRYPRLLALCIMLLEIGLGEPLPVQDCEAMEGTLNANWNLAKRLVDKPKSWGDFDYPDYRKVVSNCLNRTLFDEAGETEKRDSEVSVITRKAVLYEAVVAPLENLLKLLGFLEDLDNIEPMDSRGSNPVLNLLPSSTIPSAAKDNSAIHSAEWLKKLNGINSYIYSITKNVAQKGSSRPVRIAILDTGYDPEAVFFRVPDRQQQMKGWKDCAGDSEVPIDENGHGTHTISLAMKVAPLADFYVARVARDRSKLRQSCKNITEAIRWAAEDCEADIISMSFGFQEEIPEISQAIGEAELKRQKRILFFAAASNSGGNRKEMFPANHDAVISVRSTNSNGAFSDTNPPADPHGPAVYGTLGQDVPSAWLCNVDGELSKSGSSVATAVAAGIAAMILAFAEAGFQSPDVHLHHDVKRLWTRRGMLAMFAKMSEDMGNRCYFISPIKFFSERDAVRGWAAMIDACV